MAPHSSTLAWKIPWTEEPGGLQSMGSLRVGHDWATSLSLFTFMHWRRKWATHSSVLAWRIPGTAEPGGLPSMGSHRVGHDWSDLAAVAADVFREGNGTPLQYSCLENPMGGGTWWAAVHGVAKSWTWLSDFTFTFHFPALEKEMATHSSVLAWRIPGTAEPGGLPSLGSHRVGHDWSDLAAAAAAAAYSLNNYN